MKMNYVWIALVAFLSLGLAQAADSDGDGVDDSVDFCPDANFNRAVDDYGCSILFFVNDSGVRFFWSNPRPKDSSVEVLESAVESLQQVMRRYPQMQFTLTGYGDGVNDRSRGLQRAEFVRDFWASRGVDTSRITVEAPAYSEAINCDTDRSERCRERNRRVVMSLR